MAIICSCFLQALWTGQYSEGGKLYPFDLNLDIQGNTITGEGQDQVGTFTLLNGQVGPTGQVQFTKQYHEQHAVNYTGQLTKDGTSMSGMYSVGSSEGSFIMTQQM